MKKHAGFTLIELMITVAIVAILAAIVYPSYQDSVRRGNRGTAQSFLMDVAQREQQVFLDRRSYEAAANNAAFPGSALNISVPGEIADLYEVSVAVTAGPPPTFTVTAAPKAGTIQVEDGNLTLNSNGIDRRKIGSSCYDWNGNSLALAQCP